MESAYAAGLFDGEGTVALSYETSKHEFRQPAVSVASTTPELLDSLKLHHGRIDIR